MHLPPALIRPKSRVEDGFSYLGQALEMLEGLFNSGGGPGKVIFEANGGVALLVVAEEIERGHGDVEAGQEFALRVEASGLCGDLHGRGQTGWLGNGQRTLISVGRPLLFCSSLA